MPWSEWPSFSRDLPTRANPVSQHAGRFFVSVSRQGMEPHMASVYVLLIHSISPYFLNVYPRIEIFFYFLIRNIHKWIWLFFFSVSAWQWTQWLLVDFGVKALAGIHYFYCTRDLLFFLFFNCFDITWRILNFQGLVSNFTIAAHSFFTQQLLNSQIFFFPPNLRTK